MIEKQKKLRMLAAVAASLALFLAFAEPQVEARRPKYPDVSQFVGGKGKGVADSKLTTDLRILLSQFSGRKGAAASGLRFSKQQLASVFDIKSDEANPEVRLAISLAPGASERMLTSRGVAVVGRVGNVVLGRAPILSVVNLEKEDAVTSVGVMFNGKIPDPRRRSGTPEIRLPTKAAGEPAGLETAELTGKGVIIAVIDTGIDWRHQDFIKPDGKTRILYLYDMTSDAYEKSDGKTGTKPPFLEGEKPLGTLYTREQVNEALSGSGKVESTDKVGHGTACAGTAAGNGRATANGVPAGTYMGSAPGAELIAVKAGDGSFSMANVVLAARWIAETAQKLDKPAVINMSLGRQWSAHDGLETDEEALNELLDMGKKQGLAICVSAGNEREDNSHAGGRFGPKVEGQQDVMGFRAQVVANDSSILAGYFDAKDEWGAALVGAGKLFVDEKGNWKILHVLKYDGAIHMTVQTEEGFQDKVPDELADIVEVEHGKTNDVVKFSIESGVQWIYGYGATKNVTSGRVNYYVHGSASFGFGSVARYVVGSPGNATHVITVGSYNSRKSWTNLDGKATSFNLALGELSSFTCPGYRRDGLVKPDITAPGTYAISSLAKDCEMAMDAKGDLDKPFITEDGYHFAWTGTSAAAPYVTGVIALMLQKNPHLTTLQIKEILRKSAKSDALTGGVPNPDWGYGKIDPAAAIKMTPAGTD